MITHTWIPRGSGDMLPERSPLRFSDVSHVGKFWHFTDDVLRVCPPSRDTIFKTFGTVLLCYLFDRVNLCISKAPFRHFSKPLLDSYSLFVL